jgi:hypothetical protein
MTKYDIYLIWGKDQDGNILRYYGSTANFIKRKSQHKINYERWVEEGRPNKNKCSSVFILDNGDWRMEKIDEIDGERWEARKKEGEYIKNNDCVNINIASRSRKEWRKDNKYKLAEYKKQYQIDNKEKIAEYKKQYQIDNKEKIAKKIAEYRKHNIDKFTEYCKQYYNKNKDKLIEQSVEYYNDNKQAILEKNKEKFKCECGSEIRKSDIAQHRKTKKHINFISNNQKMSDP